MNRWKTRIVGAGFEDPEQLLANPANWRIHPKEQQDALEGVLDKVGWVQNVVVNRQTGFVVDGHLRVSMAITARERVPVIYVDLSPEEEALVLATIDPLAAMAGRDNRLLSDLLRGVADSDLGDLGDGIAALLTSLGGACADEQQGAGGAGLGGVGNPATLAERFLVPPFSVLDARQGYWQERKRAWLALGIESELGRGDVLPGGGGGPETESAWIRKGGERAVPGGSKMPGVSRVTGKIVRTDSRARPIEVSQGKRASAKPSRRRRAASSAAD